MKTKMLKAQGAGFDYYPCGSAGNTADHGGIQYNIFN